MDIINPSITYDPLALLPFEITEKIFRKLPVKDLLQASCVSSTWYDFIGTSTKLIKQIKLKITCNMDRDQSTQAISAVTNGSRTYEALEIERCAQCMDSIFPLVKSKKWKEIIIKNSCFNNPEQAFEFFTLIHENVQKIQMNAVCVKSPYYDGKNKGLMFPKLQYLVSRYAQACLFPEIFQNVCDLRYFELSSNDQNLMTLRTVSSFLKRNEHLEVLQISGGVFHQVMYNDISMKVTFKLKKLTIANGQYSTGDFYKRIYKNVAALLKQQGESLEALTVDDWMGEEVLKTVFRLPKLKELTIKGFTHICGSDLSLSGLVLDSSSSIMKLNLTMVSDDFNTLKSIILATPNLKSLTISLMNFHFMDFISKNAKNLESLTIGFLNVTYIPRRNLFKNLKHLDVKDFRVCLQESIMRKPFQALSDFEMMLFFIMIG